MLTGTAKSAVLISALTLGAVAGCETGTPGVTRTATLAYSMPMNATPTVVVKGAEAVIADFKLTKVSSAATELDGKVVATTATGKQVTITVGRTTDKISEVTVRVGDAFGDESLSNQILKAIKEKVKG